MHDPFTRASHVLLAAVGAATLGLSFLGPAAEAGWVGHQMRLVTAGSGAALLLAPLVARMKWPAMAAGILLKGAFLLAWPASAPAVPSTLAAAEGVMVLILAVLLAVDWSKSRREAAWNGAHLGLE